MKFLFMLMFITVTPLALAMPVAPEPTPTPLALAMPVAPEPTATPTPTPATPAPAPKVVVVPPQVPLIAPVTVTTVIVPVAPVAIAQEVSTKDFRVGASLLPTFDRKASVKVAAEASYNVYSTLDLGLMVRRSVANSLFATAKVELFGNYFVKSGISLNANESFVNIGQSFSVSDNFSLEMSYAGVKNEKVKESRSISLPGALTYEDGEFVRGADIKGSEVLEVRKTKFQVTPLITISYKF